MISDLYFYEIIAIITFLNDWEKIPDLCIRNIYLEESCEGIASDFNILDW